VRAEAAESAVLCITVVYSPAPRVLHEITLTLPAGARVSDALAACALDERFAAVFKAPAVGLWGKRVPPTHTLADHDRIEIYRPLRVDPKVARRERFKKQGAKSAGLFAQRRPGAKAGY
jgi:putative ubiquitin-RnfH superfamily antitoxin RatB of RatAB toxin-antitoxin module